MAPKFSIVIPVYNAEKYLDRCISSCVNQTYKDFEIILINDGSKDSSGVICDEYVKKDSRIKVIHQENAGVSTARNAGVKETTGDYMIFVDSDDFIEINVLEKLNNILQKNDVDCIIYNLNNRIDNKIICEDTWNKDIMKLIITEIINSPCNKVYKRNIIERYNIKFDKEIEIGEDLLFNIIYLSKIKNIYLFNDMLYNYTKENDNSLTAKYKENKYEQLMFVDDKVQEYLKNYNDEKLLECVNFIRLKNIFSCFMDLSHRNCKYSKKEKIQFIKKVKKENKIVIKKLGLKFHLASLIYLVIPSQLLLLTAKGVSILKAKSNSRGE